MGRKGVQLPRLGREPEVGGRVVGDKDGRDGRDGKDGRIRCRGLERLRVLPVDQRHPRPGVPVEVGDGVRLQVRVDHHHGGPDLQDAEQRRHEVRPVGQRHDDALLRHHPRLPEQAAIPVRQRLHVPVAPRPLVGHERHALAPALAHPRIQEMIGEVEVLGMLEDQGQWAKVKVGDKGKGTS